MMASASFALAKVPSATLAGMSTCNCQDQQPGQE